MRVTSDFWVGAYLRICQQQGGFAVVARRGAREAGAIFLRVDRGDGFSALYAPAPQTSYDDTPHQRLFLSRFTPDFVDEEQVSVELARQIRFDPDLWIIGVDDRLGRCFLGDALVSA